MADFHSLKATQLEKSLGSTIYAKYRSVMDNYIVRDLKSGTFSIPTIQALVSESISLEESLLALYDRKMSMVDTSHISDEIKVLQASLFDGLAFGLNTEKGMEMSVYTANTKAIFNVDDSSAFSMEKTLELNEQGVIHAVRVDIEYTSEDGFKFKAVNLNKNTNLKVVDLETGEGRFYLVPYIAIQRSMVFFKEQLEDGRTLEVTQDRGDILKVRNISARGSELAKYCDDEVFAKSLKPEYFPLKGFFYAPSLGASSFTTGKTKIELLTVNKVANVVKPKVEKAKGFESVVEEMVIRYLLSELYKYDDSTYTQIISKLPKKSKYFPDTLSDYPSVASVMLYYKDISDTDKEKVKSLLEIGNFSGIKKDWSSLINRSEPVNVEGLSKDDINNMLKDGIYKIVVRKTNCSYTSMLVTNSKKLLADMYGTYYFREYESFGVRLYAFEDKLSKGIVSEDTMRDYLDECGFDYSHKTVKGVYDILRTKDGDSTHDRLAELLGDNGDGTKKKTRSSSSNPNNILARACFATISGTGSSEYYKYIDVSRIVSISRVG